MGSKSKMPAARLGDIDTGHPPSPPTPVIMGSTNVLINSRPAARQGDMLVPHHPGVRKITEGSGSVKINGKPAARVTDGINCGGKLIIGSGNVLIGDQPEKARNSKLSVEVEEFFKEKSSSSTSQHLTPFESTQLAASIAVKYRGEEGAVETWHDHYMSNEPSTPPQTSAEKKGLQRAQAEILKALKEDAELQKQIADNNQQSKTINPLSEKMIDAMGSLAEDDYATPAMEAIAGQMLSAVGASKADKKSIESFSEGIERLKAARNKISERKKAGLPAYMPKYTDDQLLQLVETGEVAKERFFVSVQPKDDNTDAKLAFEKESGLVTVWATYFDQIEAADTDPLLIHQILGAESNYDPNKEYVMHIIDRGEDLENFGDNSIVPTWENLAKASSFELDGDKEVISSVSNPAYQNEYAKILDDFRSKGGNEFSEIDVHDFSSSMPEESRKKFIVRHKIRTEIGANSDFTGNGLTKNTASGGGNFGVVETLSIEKRLQKLAKLQSSGIVKTVPLIPIT